MVVEGSPGLWAAGVAFPSVLAIAHPVIGFIQDYLVLESKASPFGEEMGRSEKRFGQSRSVDACGLASLGGRTLSRKQILKTFDWTSPNDRLRER